MPFKIRISTIMDGKKKAFAEVVAEVEEEADVVDMKDQLVIKENLERLKWQKG